MSGNFKRRFKGLIILFKQILEAVSDFRRTATGGTTTTVVDSSLSSSSDYDDAYNGYLLRFKDDTTTSALRGVVRKVTDYAGATGTLTVATLPASPSSGDTFDLYLCLPASNLSKTTAPEILERDFETLTYDKPSAQMGLPTVQCGFDVELLGLETPRTQAQGATDSLDPLDQLLKGVLGSRTVGEGTQVSGGSSTTTSIDVDDASVFSVKDLVKINGQIRRVTAVDTVSTPNNITLHRALTAAPADNDEVYAAVTYKSTEEDHDSWQVGFVCDDQLVLVGGCRFNLKGACTFGQDAMLSLEGNGSTYEEVDGYVISEQQSSQKKIPMIAGACDFGGTAVGVTSLEFDFGHTVSMVKDTEAHVAIITNRDSTTKIKFRNTSKAPKSWQLNGTVASLLIQIGNTAGKAAAILSNAQFRALNYGEENELHYYDGELKQADDHTSATENEKLVLARF